MRVLTEEARTIDGVWWAFFWAAVVIGAVVVLLVAWCVVRYRRTDDRLPRQVRQHIPTEIVYTVVPVLIVAALAGITVRSLGDVDATREPEVVVEVVAYQWQWRFRYPASGVVVDGSADEWPELVLPAGTTVRFEMTSRDVIHSFWVPAFRFKRDVWPGRVQTFDVRILDETGRFEDGGACGEYCGLDHAGMRFALRIVTKEEFAAWQATVGATGEDGL